VDVGTEVKPAASRQRNSNVVLGDAVDLIINGVAVTGTTLDVVKPRDNDHVVDYLNGRLAIWSK